MGRSSDPVDRGPDGPSGHSHAQAEQAVAACLVDIVRRLLTAGFRCRQQRLEGRVTPQRIEVGTSSECGRREKAAGSGARRIDGPISHAFLKRYVWTIDFDSREYRFTEPPSTE